MSIYLTSYYPLCCNAKGRTAIRKYPSLYPYIDGSCRREPDFENEMPCVTGLCRPGFAQKLVTGDIVVYVTNKRGVGSRKVVAILRVVRTFENHSKAADWYIKQKKTIPNNIMVTQTNPFDLEKTNQKFGWDSWIQNENTIKSWDDGYKERAERTNNKIVAQCEIVFRNLNSPIELSENDWKEISSRPLCTQKPPRLREDEYLNLQIKTNLNF